ILIDVIQPRRNASAHILGGRFAEMFVDAIATDPRDPGRPIGTSMGIGHGFVPPLEHELIGDGDAFENSYQTYLQNATAAAAVAERELVQARMAELGARLDDRADITLLAEAQLAEEEEISETCGTPTGCDLARRETIQLGELSYAG